MTKTIIKTIQLYCKPNKTATKQLEKILSGSNFLYNQFLKEMIKKDKEKQLQPNLSEWSKILTKLRKEHECLQIINRQILNEAIMRIKKTWKNHQKHKESGVAKRYPRIKQPHEYNSFTYPFGDKGWWIENNRLFLPQSKPASKRDSEKITIKITLHQEIKGAIQNLTIKQKNGKWYALFVSEMEKEERKPTNKYIGADLNCKENAYCVLSDGTRFKHPQNHRKSEQKLFKAQKLLSKKQEGSKNREKTRLLYAKQWEKTGNQQRDTFFKMARKLDEYDGFAREDLKIVSMMKNRKLSKAIWRCSWGNFNNINGGRAEDAGRQIVKVSPHNTTQKCSNCKELAKIKLTLKDRTFKCWNCKFKLDRDENSARNVLDKAIEQNKFEIGRGFRLCRGATGVASLKQEILNAI